MTSPSPSPILTQEQSPFLAQDSSTATRKRARSTAGCGNCKKRKIKCDERKPRCSRCCAARLECPGYSTNMLRWSSKHEISKVSTPGERPTPKRHQAAHWATTSATTVANYCDYLDSSGYPGMACAETAIPQTEPGPDSETTDALIFLRDLHSIAANKQPPSQVLAGKAGVVDLNIASATLHAAALGQTEPLQMAENGYERCLWNPHRNNLGGIDLGANLIPQLPEDPNHEGSSRSSSQNLELSISLPTSGFRPAMSDRSSPLLPKSLLHVPTTLVEYYFQKVCRDCSTFDSILNPFRTMVSSMRLDSATMNYAIQSLAACKLADDMPRMKVVGIEAQGLALQNLNKDCSAVSTLHNISDAALCSILLLGMTTSWHVSNDIGLEYLDLARRIIAAKMEVQNRSIPSNLDFYVNALKYWTMIVSLVSGDADASCVPLFTHLPVLGPSPSSVPTKKIMPHPWTGISPSSQQLFGEVLHLIRRTRTIGSGKTVTCSRAGIMDMCNAIAAAERLHADCWSVSIPSVNDLNDTGDPDTPPIHHVLTAKAYLLSALLHIYTIFPDVLETQIQSYVTMKSTYVATEAELLTLDCPHVLSGFSIWRLRSTGDPHPMWLRDLGLCIVECLEQIDVQSSTRVVHPPLLLSVSSALVLSDLYEYAEVDQTLGRTTRDPVLAPPHNQIPSSFQQTQAELNLRVRQCRSFMIHRLETMQALMRFHAIANVLTVIKEVWRRADTSTRDVFWMDVMKELQCETLFG